MDEHDCKKKIDASALRTILTESPANIKRHEDLSFGENFTNHMLLIEWTARDGWLQPQITPYRSISLDPAACVLLYTFRAFEGMKAYMGIDNQARLFRPDKNMARLNQAASQLGLPNFDEETMVDLLKSFVRCEERFIPRERGYSLYLRPNIIGTQATLRIETPSSALLYVIASPVGAPYSGNLRLLSGKVIETPALSTIEHVNAKTGETETFMRDAGTMNLFIVWKTTGGERELVTPPLSDHILNGVMRSCILELARERLAEKYQVSERDISIEELMEASTVGRLLEVFGSNTATIVTPVKEISHKQQYIACDAIEDLEAEKLSRLMRRWIEDIQYGAEPGHAWSIPVGK